MNMKLIKITTTLAKICEILLWIANGAMVISLFICLFAKDMIEATLMESLDDGTISVSGFETQLIDSTGSINRFALACALIAGIVAISLTAMIFRNITLIFKSESPFCKDNIRMVQEIGIFAISIPAVQVILSILVTLAIGHEYSEVAVDFKTVVFGFVILCLSQYFRYGATLEKDMDGLV